MKTIRLTIEGAWYTNKYNTKFTHDYANIFWKQDDLQQEQPMSRLHEDKPNCLKQTYPNLLLQIWHIQQTT